MEEPTEYIFRKDIFGNWKLVPVASNAGCAIQIILLLIAFIVITSAIITSPLWIALLGFTMVDSKRHYAGLASVLAMIYFIIDMKKQWISGFLLTGYYDSSGEYTEGLFSSFSKYIDYLWIANSIGVALGLYFIYDRYVNSNQK